MPSLIDKAGEQGLPVGSALNNTAVLQKDFITATIVNEGLGGGFSFQLLWLPIQASVHYQFYTLVQEEQKAKYSQTCKRRMEKALYGLTDLTAATIHLAQNTATLSGDGNTIY